MTVKDKPSDTIKAIRDYDDMKLIIRNTPSGIAEQYQKLESPCSSRLSDMPKQRHLQAMEEMWSTGIDKLDLMRNRYHKAKLFIVWFEPMWLAFTEEEREILETYNWSDTRSGIGKRLAQKLGYSDRNFGHIRQRLLKRLSKLLYGT